jgi:hypothetical protein
MTADWLAAAGLALGVIMGLVMLARPVYGGAQLGLISDPARPGGIGEQRAFGGMLIGVHGASLMALVSMMRDHAPPAQPVLLAVAAGWLCATIGRALSVLVDRRGVALNLRYLALDAAMTLAIGAPLLWPPGATR